MTALAIALGAALAACAGALAFLAVQLARQAGKLSATKDVVIQHVTQTAEAEKAAAVERARADEAERMRAIVEGELQMVSREWAADKRAHEAQLMTLRQEIEESDHDLRNRPDHRAERTQRLLQLAAARGRPSTSAPPAAPGGGGEAGVHGGGGAPVAGAPR